MTPARPRSTGAIAAAAALDAALITLFAATGRGNHAEGVDLVGVLGTAWPFLAGGAVGWVLARAWQRPLAVWPTGAVVWAATLVGGMLLRAATGQGTALPFVVVAALTLGLFLIGWRALAVGVLALRRRRAEAAVR